MYEHLCFNRHPSLTQLISSHATHHLYAIYTLGAPGDVLRAALESHAVYQRPAFASPEEITDSNWKEHFGDEQYVMSNHMHSHQSKE